MRMRKFACGYLAKASVKNTPIVGSIAISLQTVFVDRGDAKDREKVFNQIHLDVSKYFEHGRNQILKIALKNDIKYAIFKDGSPSDGVHKIYDGTFSRNKIPGKGRVTSLLEENNIKVYSEDEVDLFIQEVLVRN